MSGLAIDFLVGKLFIVVLTGPGHVTIKSQSRCDEDSQTGQGSSISDSQVLHTPASLSCYSSTYDWHKKTTKTPDALAEIMVRLLIIIIIPVFEQCLLAEIEI